MFVRFSSVNKLILLVTHNKKHNDDNNFNYDLFMRHFSASTIRDTIFYNCTKKQIATTILL